MSGEHPKEGKDELLTIAQITQLFRVSRQTLHRLRVSGAFPAPEHDPGSTRAKWRESVVSAYFVTNPLRPGARTDLQRQAPEKEPPNEPDRDSGPEPPHSEPHAAR